MRKKKIEVATC